MMTNRTLNVFGYISLAIMAVILLLMWQRMVPENWYWTLFSVALVLFLLRIAMRLILARQKRQRQDAATGSAGGTGGGSPERPGGAR